MLQMLPFIEIVGNGLTYNRENAAAAAAFFGVGDIWAESTPTFTQLTGTLNILGGDADIDNFLRATRSSLQALEAAVVQLKAKAVQLTFDESHFCGCPKTRQVAGSLTLWLERVHTARNSPSGEMVNGRSCALILFDPGNPRDASVIAVWT
ncbi:MAG: hypothetical protein EXR55_03380 [Dehalococcoidia bacterium]|nr:hypothetical protein [Dehalococcoidia bacterium]